MGDAFDHCCKRMVMMANPARRLEAARQKYPALGVAEILVWREYLRLHEAEYSVLPDSWLAFRATTPQPPPQPGDVFDYNLRIGTGRDPGPEFDQSIRDQWVEKTKFRVDAVGFQGQQPFLFEVDRHAGGPQVGQLLSYAAIWRATKLTPADPQLVLVSADINENAMHLVRESNIQAVTVPVDFRVLSPYSTVPIGGTEGTS